MEWEGRVGGGASDGENSSEFIRIAARQSTRIEQRKP